MRDQRGRSSARKPTTNEGLAPRAKSGNRELGRLDGFDLARLVEAAGAAGAVGERGLSAFVTRDELHRRPRSCCWRRMSRLLRGGFPLGDGHGLLLSVSSSSVAARSPLLRGTTRRSAPSLPSPCARGGRGAVKGADRGDFLRGRRRVRGAGRIPGQPSEHKGKFGTSSRIASRTNSSRTTVSPSNVSRSASAAVNSTSSGSRSFLVLEAPFVRALPSAWAVPRGG